MSIEDAKKLGYELIPAGIYEVGLTRKGKGIRRWWLSEFSTVPSLDHPLVQKAIEISEINRTFWGDGEGAAGPPSSGNLA